MIPEHVRKILDECGLAAREFDAGTTATAETAARMLGVQVGQIAKSLLFAGKNGKHYMVLCAGDKRVSSSLIKKLVGCKVSMADAETTETVTGFRPGGVCPFGVTNVVVYIDRSLSVWDTVYPAAGTDSSGVPVAYERLKAIVGATECSVTE
jgi:prolyl-tRNA editing enzyme YbaK/EbsC (Cys-tRNA(Pro) deacylase)